MHLSAKVSLQRPTAVAVLSVLLTISVSPIRADDGSDAQAVADAYLKLLDRDDTEGAYRQVGEQWKRTTSKSEWMAGMRMWLEAKGGAASSREIVAQRALSKDESRQISPQSTVEGTVYAFRYRAKYPKGVFFEDVMINRDSDGVLRVAGHHPQPA